MPAAIDRPCVLFLGDPACVRRSHLCSTNDRGSTNDICPANDGRMLITDRGVWIMPCTPAWYLFMATQAAPSRRVTADRALGSLPQPFSLRKPSPATFPTTGWTINQPARSESPSPTRCAPGRGQQHQPLRQAPANTPSTGKAAPWQIAPAPVWQRRAGSAADQCARKSLAPQVHAARPTATF